MSNVFQSVIKQRLALERMPERDKQILALARRAVNALGFALQNAHNMNAVCKYEKQSDDAMRELMDLLAAPYMEDK